MTLEEREENIEIMKQEDRRVKGLEAYRMSSWTALRVLTLRFFIPNLKSDE
jgi:hypothetical protein